MAGSSVLARDARHGVDSRAMSVGQRCRELAGRCLRGAVILCAGALLGCEAPAATGATGVAAAPPAPLALPAGAGRELATPTAFDLVAAPEGVVLAWAEPGPGRLRVERFGADGRPESALVEALGVAPGAADLAAAAVKGGLALAWREPAARRLRAAWSDAAGARSFELGESPGAASVRGRLGLAPRGQGALLFARGEDARCDGAPESAAPCARLRLFELDGQGVRPAGVPLSVPGACDRHVALLAADPRHRPGEAPGGLDYAVCTRSESPRALTIFSIRQQPAYAAAEQVLAGCSPLGAGRFGGQATFVAACGAGRRMAVADAERGGVSVRSLETRGLICGAGGAQLRLGDGWLRLVEPLDRLELLLDDDLAPPGARAAWAGEVLFVAREAQGRLELTRHACRGRALHALPSGDEPGAGATHAAGERDRQEGNP